jgi:phage tail P2-like protein
MIDLKNIKLQDIMPPNLLRDEKVNNLAEVLSNELKIVSENVYKIEYSRIEELTEDVIDHLLWEYHVQPFEGLNLADTLEKKRQLLTDSIETHRKKGTPWSVEKIVSTLFSDAKVSEWYEYGGEPYFFRIETEQPITSEFQITQLVRLIDNFKNKRSWLDNITVIRDNNMELYVGGIVQEWKQVNLEHPVFKMPDLIDNQHCGGFVSYWNRYEIYMEVNHEWLTTRVLF